MSLLGGVHLLICSDNQLKDILIQTTWTKIDYAYIFNDYPNLYHILASTKINSMISGESKPGFGINGEQWEGIGIYIYSAMNYHNIFTN